MDSKPVTSVQRKAPTERGDLKVRNTAVTDTPPDLEVETLRDEIASRSLRMYNSRLKGELEQAHNGRFLAIEPISEKYFLGNTATEALIAARNAMPDANFYMIRIGHRTAHNIGGHVSRNR